ncbi:MAG: ABC transporter substrate-binding protein [Defluviitaleaceae bacterium]|nr:ABC transporter substrate-binding protein [Defluviitaleaceae bacterium]
MKLMKKGIIVLLGLLVMAVALSACARNNEPAETTRTITDRDGYTTTVPSEISTIVSLGPSNAEILVALGLGDKIIAVDRYSADVVGLGAGVPRSFGIMDFDVEYIMELMPDIIFATDMIRAGGDDDPMAPISAVGITVVYVPISASIAAIMEDIQFIANVMGTYDAGQAIITQMQTEIDRIAYIAATISAPRTVYFEISPAPWMFSFGQGTFLHEMIELVGAVNIFASQEGWVGVSEEVLLELDPDVILTSSGEILDDPVAEIMGRPGFDILTAVQNNSVFEIDTAASNQPSHNIIIALRQIAEAVFPEYFL